MKVSRNRAPVFDPPSSKRTRETFTGGGGRGRDVEINRKSVKRVVVYRHVQTTVVLER